MQVRYIVSVQRFTRQDLSDLFVDSDQLAKLSQAIYTVAGRAGREFGSRV